MPGRFTFGAQKIQDAISSKDFLSLTRLSKGGAAQGVNNSAHYSAISTDGAIQLNQDVDIIAISLLAGQKITLDIDDGAGDDSSIDLEIDLIDSKGSLIAFVDDASVDNGSFGGQDPRLTHTVTKTGIYFVAVRHFAKDYVDDGFTHASPGINSTGDYTLIVSTPDLPTLQTLSNSANIQAFGDSRQRLDARDGDDALALRGGDDIADGNAGHDTLQGGSGDDLLSGGAGNDRLYGNSGDDALVDGAGKDRLFGGDGRDDLAGGVDGDRLNGGAGNDRLSGDDGNDRIEGGGGDDFIRGGLNVDELRGGAGKDVFHFLAGEANLDRGGFQEDRIFDFSGADLIDLSDLYSGKLEFVEGDFSGANQVRTENYGADEFVGQEVQVNLDAETSTIELAFLVDLSGGNRLGSFDFIL